MGFRIIEEVHLPSLIESLSKGLRMTVINEDVNVVLMHTPPHIPLLSTFYERRLEEVVNKLSKYLRPLPNGITAQILDGAANMYVKMSNTINTKVRVEGNVSAVTICHQGNEIIHNMFMRGPGLSTEELLDCKRIAEDDEDVHAIPNIKLTKSPEPGSMVMTRLYPIDINIHNHLMIFGAVGSGKSTLTKIIINHALTHELFNRVVVLDFTGEYALTGLDRGYVAIPGIDIAVNPLILPQQRISELLASTVQTLANLYGEDEGNVSFIQLEVLDKALENLPSKSTLIDLLKRLDQLSESYKRIDYLNAAMAVKRRIRKLLFSALLQDRLSSHAMKSRLLIINLSPLYEISQTATTLFVLSLLEIHRELLRNSLIIIDEAHRLISRGAIGDSIIEQELREGRHTNTTLILITQNPQDIKRSVLDVIPQYAVFKLSGNAAMEAARLIGKELRDLLNLEVFEFMYHTRSFTVKAYIHNPGVFGFTVHEFSRSLFTKMLDVIDDETKVRKLASKYGRAADPIITPHIIDEGLREGYTLKDLVMMAMNRDANYMRLLSRVMIGEH